MTCNTGNWKDDSRGHDLCLLADVEQGVDEMFRPYTPTISVPVAHRQGQNQPPPLAPPEQQKTPGQMFEVVVRSFTQRWQSPANKALSCQSHAPPAVRTSAPRIERFAPIVVPEIVAATTPPLPHEVREELLALQLEVVQSARTRHLQTLMICGVDSGVGSSFIAGHLTRMLAEYAQMNVAFLTLVSNREKKVNRLARRSIQVPPPLQFLLRRTELPNLAEIASANGTISLTELLCHCPTAEVLHQMKQEFDLIVIDAPAIAIYGEAAMLAALVDGVILVAAPNVTPLRRMDRTHRRLRNAQAKVLGMVFNRQRRP